MPEARHWLDAIELGTGCWQWGDTLMWGYGQGYAGQEVQTAFEGSLSAGITFFDTAEVYGMRLRPPGWGISEEFLGGFLRARGPAAPRVIVATKFFPFPWRLSRGALLAALRNSLQRLGLQQVDLYQTHWPLPPVTVETWMEAMADAVEAGLVRSVGVSNYNVAQTQRAYATLKKRGVPLLSNQVPYSLLNRKIEHTGLRALCQELDIKIIAYSPIEKGLLTGKYTPDHPPAGARGRIYSRDYLTQIQPLITLLREIGQAHGGKTPAQVALNWLICKGALPIPGAKNAQQAQDNAGATGWRLTGAEVKRLEAVEIKSEK